MPTGLHIETTTNIHLENDNNTFQITLLNDLHTRTDGVMPQTRELYYSPGCKYLAELNMNDRPSAPVCKQYTKRSTVSQVRMRTRNNT